MNIGTADKPATETQDHWETVCDEVLSLQVATSSYDDLDSVKKNLELLSKGVF